MLVIAPGDGNLGSLGRVGTGEGAIAPPLGGARAASTAGPLDTRKGHFPMTRFFYTILVLLAVACGGPVESDPTNPSPDEPACGPDGYVLPGAQPGDVYRACGPERIQTTVTTGGEIAGYWERPCLTITVETVEPGADELVVDLRGAGGRSLCADTFERVMP